MAHCQILSWQDIPSQVKAWDDFDEVSLELSSQFMMRIDQAAQSQGLTGTDEYLSQWSWSAEEERDGTAEEVAQAVKAELESKIRP